MVLSVFMIYLVGGCGSGGEDKATCDEGTHEEDGTCLPDEASDADADADTDTDTDADTDADADADTDTDADTDHSGEGGFAWCAAGGHASDGVATLISCLAPVDVAASETATDGSYTLLPGPIRRLVP